MSRFFMVHCVGQRLPKNTTVC